MLSKDKNDQKCHNFLYWNSFIKTEIIFFYAKNNKQADIGSLWRVTLSSRVVFLPLITQDS